MLPLLPSVVRVGLHTSVNRNCVVVVLKVAKAYAICLFSLAHTEHPAVFTKPLTDQTCQECANVSFTCQLSKPNKKVSWYMGEAEVTPNEKYTVTVDGCTHTLTLKNVQMDETNAEFTAKIGDESSSAKLTVNG